MADEKTAALKKATGVPGVKDEFQVRLKGRERGHLMCTEIGMLGGREYKNICMYMYIYIYINIY